MKKIVSRLILFTFALLTFSVVVLAQPASGAEGHWEGAINLPNRKIGIVVDIARNSKGAWIGSMSVAESTAVDVPLTDLVVADNAVRFAASLPEQARFEGRLSADAASLSGKATNVAGEAPFALTRNGEPNAKVPAPSSPLSDEFKGLWEGEVEAAGKTSRIQLRLASAQDGTAVATLISVDKGKLEIPITTVIIEGKQLRMEARSISGSYEGTLRSNGEIAGVWSESSKEIPLVFKRAATAPQKP